MIEVTQIHRREKEACHGTWGHGTSGEWPCLVPVLLSGKWKVEPLLPSKYLVDKLQAFAASRVSHLFSVVSNYGDLRSTDLPHFFVHSFPACFDDYPYVEAAPRGMPYPGGG